MPPVFTDGIEISLGLGMPEKDGGLLPPPPGIPAAYDAAVLSVL
jgi:hypothetical protein